MNSKQWEPARYELRDLTRQLTDVNPKLAQSILVTIGHELLSCHARFLKWGAKWGRRRRALVPKSTRSPAPTAAPFLRWDTKGRTTLSWCNAGSDAPINSGISLHWWNSPSKEMPIDHSHSDCKRSDDQHSLRALNTNGPLTKYFFLGWERGWSGGWGW